MSSMLEQAMIDAEALRETAMKNAESIIIDKYSADVKKVVQSLLEQDDFDLEGESEEEALGAAAEEGDPDLDAQVPSAHSAGSEGGEEVDALRDAVGAAEEALEDVSDKLDNLEVVAKSGDETDVEIDLNQLRAQLDGEEGPLDPEDMTDREELAGELEEEPPPGEEAPLPGEEEEEDDLEIDDDLLETIVQELRVDIDPQASGWMNYPSPALAHAVEQKLAHDQDDDVKEENEALKKAMKGLQTENKNLTKDNGTTEQNNKKLQQTILHLKEKFDEINLSNARLLYTNKVLNSASLNERQKNKIVEAISKADTIEEAKVIYETLESAAGTFQKEDMPKSLSEVVQRGSSMLVSRNRKREESVSESFSERMQKLAGIK